MLLFLWLLSFLVYFSFCCVFFFVVSFCDQYQLKYQLPVSDEGDGRNGICDYSIFGRVV